MYNKIIACDISGTLLNSKGKYSDELKENLEMLKKNNIAFILCSGGARPRTKELANIINASDYCISSNGADATDTKNNLTIYKEVMNTQTVMKIYEYAINHNFRIALNTENYIYTNKLIYNSEYEKIINESIINKNDIVQCIVSSLERDSFNKFIEKINEIEGIKIAIKNINGNNNDINKIKMCYSDIVSCSASKGNALKKLSQHLKVKKEDIIAIGDSVNDISLFEESGYRIAVANAVPELINESDLVIKSNDNQGVCEYIKKLIKRM